MKLKQLKLDTVSYCWLRLKLVQIHRRVIQSNLRQDANFDKSQVRAGLENPFLFGTAVYTRVNYSLQN